jgi:hypothetical protein
VVILASFALAWTAAGQSGISVPGVVRLITVAVVALGFRASGRRVPPRAQPAGWYRRVGRINLAQFAAIVAVIALLGIVGAPQLVPAGICLVVGLHFIPLSGLFAQPQYRWTGIALCVVAVVGIAVFAATGGDASRAVVGFGAALTLWATAADVAVRG